MAGASHTEHLYAHKHMKQHTTLVSDIIFVHMDQLQQNANVPADEGFDAFTSNRCHAHGHRLRGGEPVGVIITGGKVANVVDVTKQEGHGAEFPQAAACRT